MVLGLLGTILSGVVDAMGTVVSFIGRILSMAPKPIRIAIFLIVGIGLLATISNWFIAAEYVCSEDTVYEASGLMWSIAAKAKPPELEFDSGIPQGVKDRFYVVEDDSRSTDTPLEPFTEQPAAIDFITDEDYSQIGFTEFGTFMGRAGDMLPESAVAGLDDDVLVIALPLTFEGENVSEFSSFAKWLDEKGGIFTVAKEAQMYICKIPEDHQPGPVERALLESRYGGPGPGQCFLKAPPRSKLLFDASFGCGFDATQIAKVTYTIIKLDEPEDRKTERTDPTAYYEVQTEDGVVWSFNVFYENPTTSWWLRLFNIGQDQNLDACPQTPYSQSVLLTPSNVQYDSSLWSGAIFGDVEENVPEQAGFVKALYVPIDEIGIDELLRSEGEELRKVFMEQHSNEYTTVVFDNDATVSFSCNEDQDVVVEVWGVAIFEPVFIITFLFFIGVLTFILRYIL